MAREGSLIYPGCEVVIRVVSVGGLSKTELLRELQRNAISLNEYADRLFASDRFATSPSRYSVTTVELTVGDLGFPHGAATAEIYARTASLDLSLCPLELGPHFGLQYPQQFEGDSDRPQQAHRAPRGAITVASQPLSDAEDFPRGFYLRRIDGALWLRGYRARSDHIWDAGDRLLFRK